MGETVEKIYCCDRGDNDNAQHIIDTLNNHSSSCTSSLIEIEGTQGSFYTSLGTLFFINNSKDKLYAVIQRHKAELSCIHS